MTINKNRFLELRIVENKRKIDAIKINCNHIRAANMDDLVSRNKYICVVSEEAYNWIKNKT